jgi:dTDP-6-deoxy-L-talose 4-dehydrogenase (NAD+)
MFLITGASGFLGRQIYRSLAGQGKDLRAILRENAHLECSPRTETIRTADLFSESLDWWQRALEGIDTFVHAAWYAEPSLCLSSRKNLDCLAGTLTMAEACVQAGVRRFVGIGTCFEYDLVQGILSIETPLKPTSLYAASKASAYMSLRAYFCAQGIEFAWCRPFYLFGEGEDPRRFVPYLHQQLSRGQKAMLTGGNQIRDYMDVRDAGRLIAEVACGDQTGPVNVCSSVPKTVRQIAESVADLYGRRDLLEFGARPHNFTDPPCVVGVSNIKQGQ